MDESRYRELAEAAFRQISDLFESVDPDACDCEIAGDVITLTFKNGIRGVINTQRPSRQIWLAANARAWHFSYDEARGQWVDDKGGHVELFGEIARLVKEHAGLALPIP